MYIYIYIHTHIIIRRPLLARGQQAAKKAVLSQRSMLFLPSLIYHISNILPTFHQQLLFDGQQVSKLVFDSLEVSKLVIQTCYQTPWMNNLPSTRRIVSAWGGSGETLKFIEISSNLQYPKNHQISVPRLPKVSKTRSKQIPEIIKFMKKSKK